MLDFVVEWHDAPGVKDAVLAKTWARLEIHISDYQSPPHFLTQCIRSKVNSVHRGVYSSVFPLAEWVVENWWFLLFEPITIAIRNVPFATPSVSPGSHRCSRMIRRFSGLENPLRVAPLPLSGELIRQIHSRV